MKLYLNIGAQILIFVLLAYIYYRYQRSKIIKNAKQDVLYQAQELFKSEGIPFPLEENSLFHIHELGLLKQNLMKIACSNQENQELKNYLLTEIEGLLKILK